MQPVCLPFFLPRTTPVKFSRSPCASVFVLLQILEVLHQRVSRLRCRTDTNRGSTSSNHLTARRSARDPRADPLTQRSTLRILYARLRKCKKLPLVCIAGEHGKQERLGPDDAGPRTTDPRGVARCAVGGASGRPGPRQRTPAGF